MIKNLQIEQNELKKNYQEQRDKLGYEVDKFMSVIVSRGQESARIQALRSFNGGLSNSAIYQSRIYAEIFKAVRDSLKLFKTLERGKIAFFITIHIYLRKQVNNSYYFLANYHPVVEIIEILEHVLPLAKRDSERKNRKKTLVRKWMRDLQSQDQDLFDIMKKRIRKVRDYKASLKKKIDEIDEKIRIIRTEY